MLSLVVNILGTNMKHEYGWVVFSWVNWCSNDSLTVSIDVKGQLLLNMCIKSALDAFGTFDKIYTLWSLM